MNTKARIPWKLDWHDAGNLLKWYDEAIETFSRGDSFDAENLRYYTNRRNKLEKLRKETFGQ